MLIHERVPGDLERLLVLARRETNAEQKDRFMAVAHAIQGVETLQIQRAIARSRGFVQRWVYAYRDAPGCGIAGLVDKPRGGSVAKIRGENATRLRARLDAGPLAGDKVCTLRGKDIQRIAREELGAHVSLTSVYRALHKMGYSCLAPRPRHEKQDLAAQQKFKDVSAPFFSAR